MKIVARHLREEATRRQNVEEKDIFGRSAFNRYYYATYLNVKRGLGKCKLEWGRLAHGAIPDVLRGQVKTAFSKGMMTAKKTHDIETISSCSKALHAVDVLADIMENGYATRVTADYQPETRVDFSDEKNFKLNTVDVDKAADWSGKANGLIGTIEVAWRQING